MAKTATHITVDGERYDLHDAELAQDVSDLKSATAAQTSLVGNSTSPIFTKIKESADYTDTGFYYGEIGSEATLRTLSGINAGHVKLDVAPGEIYSITMRGRGNLKAYVLTDSSNIVIAKSDEENTSYTNTNASVVIPNGARYMYCNTVLGAESTIIPSVSKRSALGNLNAAGYSLESEISRITDAMSPVIMGITDKIPLTSGGYYYQGDMNRRRDDSNSSYGFIRVYRGEVYRISGYSYNSGVVVGVCDLNRNVLATYPNTFNSIELVDKQIINITQDGYLTFTRLDTRAAYFSVEKQVYVSDSDNPLIGKKICVDGDSICYGHGYTGGFARIIAEQNGMTVQNLAVSGATIATGTYTDGEPRHWICTSIDDFDSDGDYYIVEGGYNDPNANVPIHDSQYDDAIDTTGVFDTTGTNGAMEQLCRTLITQHTGKKLGFIFPHRINDHLWNYQTAVRRVLMKKILTKYGIPYLDLAQVSGMDTVFPQIAQTYTSSADGIHPNQLGYELFYVPKITAWLKTL